MASISQSNDLLMRYGHPLYEVNPSLPSSLLTQLQQQPAAPRADENLAHGNTHTIQNEHLGDSGDRHRRSIQNSEAAPIDLSETQKLERDRFIKFYLDGIRQFVRLNQSGADLFEFVCEQLSGENARNKDTVCLTYVLASKWRPSLNRRTYSRGLANLLDREFIFRSMLNDIYFINVRFVFNGDLFVLARSYQSGHPNY